MPRPASAACRRLLRVSATTCLLMFALGCEVLPPASADAKRCAAAVGLHLGLQRPVAVRSERSDGPEILELEFEGLNGENLPVQGHAKCGFASGDGADRSLTSVHIDGSPLATAEVEILDRTLGPASD